MRDQPLVTVVTPCRNAAAWLPTCLDSVAAQTYPNIEHLVLDAVSEDGTQALLEKRTGVTWTSEPDAGQADALLSGFARARGTVLTWLNADDTLLPDAVERVVDTLDRYPGAGLVLGGAVVEEGDVSEVIWPPADLRLTDLDQSNPLPQPSCFFTRSAYDAVGGLDPSLHLTMDLDLWLRMLQGGVEVRTVPTVLSRIVVHPGAKTRHIDREAWFREFGIARLKNGRDLAAAVAFGRASAHEAATPNGVDHARLRACLRQCRQGESRLPIRGLLAGGYAESAVLEVQAGVAPKHLFPPYQLLVPDTRREALGALRRRVRQSTLGRGAASNARR